MSYIDSQMCQAFANKRDKFFNQSMCNGHLPQLNVATEYILFLTKQIETQKN